MKPHKLSYTEQDKSEYAKFVERCNKKIEDAIGRSSVRKESIKRECTHCEGTGHKDGNPSKGPCKWCFGTGELIWLKGPKEL